MSRASLTPSISLGQQLALALGVALLVGLAARGGIFNGLENLARDWRMERRGPQKPRTKIVIVEIDSATLANPKFSKPMMFWGDHHARAIQILSASGVKAIGFDLVQAVSLGEYAQPDPDQKLAQVLTQTPNIVFNFVRTPLANGTSRDVVPNPLLLTALALGGGRTGFANTTPDLDGVVRGFAPFDNDRDQSPAFALALAEVATGKTAKKVGDKLEIGGRKLSFDDSRRAAIDYIGADGIFPRVSYLELFRQPQKYRVLLQNSVCLIGVTGYEIQDYHSIPLWRADSGKQGNLMPGVELQASILHTLLAGNDLRPIAPFWGAFLLMGAAFLAIPAAWRPRIAFTIPLFGALLVAWVLVCLGTFAKLGVFLPLVATSLAFFASFVAQTTARLWQESGRKRWFEGVMGRYVSPEVVEYLRRHPDALELGGKRREITVLFSDVRGFTTLSERLEPEQVTRFLNLYLESMVEIIFAHGGTVDKFMGDGIMVIWNWPIEKSDHAKRALECAVAMQNAVCEKNPEWQKLGMPPIEIGVGLHTGPAIVGNVGSKRRMEQTAIGDTVNAASRIEGLCKTLGKELCSGILLTETTWDAANSSFEAAKWAFEIEPAGETALRGREKPLRLFAVKANAGQTVQNKEATSKNEVSVT